MAGIAGFGQLGAALTGGGALPAALAESQGEQLGANTQNAIAEAQLRQQKFQGRQNFGQNAAVLASGSTDQNALGQALTSAAQGDIPLDMLLKGVHQQYENNSYKTITDPNTPDPVVARHLVAEGKEQGIVRPTAAGEAATNILHPEQGVTTTPLGQMLAPAKAGLIAAQTHAANASAGLHDVQADAGGFKPPAGGGLGDPNKKFQWAKDENGDPILDENGRPKVIPITGGAGDPDAPKAMGANQTAQFLRTINASRQAVADLGNVMDLPVGTSAGYFGSGIGGSQGHSLGGTVASNLSNKLNGTDSRNYNTIMSGLNQNLSALETFGLAPRGALVGSMDRLAIQPTDDEGNALIKLAQARQIVEQALQTHISNNAALSDKQRATLQPILDDIQKQIPFTVRDVLKLQNNPNSGQTLADLVKSRGFTAPAGAPAAAPAAAAPAQAAPRSFNTEAEAEAAGIEPGTRVVIGGRAGTWQ